MNPSWERKGNYIKKLYVHNDIQSAEDSTKCKRSLKSTRSTTRVGSTKDYPFISSLH
jgi:hypothetical protein